MNFFKKLNLFIVLLTLVSVRSEGHEKPIILSSPDGALNVSITLSDKIYYSISEKKQELISKSSLSIALKREILGHKPQLISVSKTKGSAEIKPYVPLKFSSIRNTYNGVILKFKGEFSVEFRVFDDGAAYRFITRKKSDIEIMDEEFAVNFSDNYLLHLQQNNGFKTAYEEKYKQLESNVWQSGDKMANLPLLIDTKKKYKILISESDLSDYPALFLKGTGNNGLKGVFPRVPLEFGPDGDRSLKIIKTADYIAKTGGSRNFPWRYFVITSDDRQLIENTMTLKLSAKSEIVDPSWVKPGQASWEWWNDATPYGPDVSFVSGYNLETYKYYIDFASKFGVKYIVMDEGWANSTTDPYTPNPKVDVKELIRYGKTKNVDIILWLTWLTVHNNMGVFKTFHEWGVKGVKVDFMERSDQWMVNYYEEVLKEAAKNQIFVDFHGSFKPAGLEYKYPNLISYEGVLGLEQMAGCTPDNSVFLPFIRNAVGPMDFTPGAMINMQPEVNKGIIPNASGAGTRAYQLALYVVFESGLQMLADNPSLYYKNLDCTEFITSVPTTWDETKALVATAGEVAIVAKRKVGQWYIGGITNSKESQRNIPITFDFLQPGKIYTMTYFEDGINAAKQAMDYRKKSIQIKAGDTITVKMVRNGGFAAVLK